MHPPALANENEAIMDGASCVEGPIIGVHFDKHSEARDWAMCSAAYAVAKFLSPNIRLYPLINGMGDCSCHPLMAYSSPHIIIL